MLRLRNVNALTAEVSLRSPSSYSSQNRKRYDIKKFGKGDSARYLDPTIAENILPNSVWKPERRLGPGSLAQW